MAVDTSVLLYGDSLLLAGIKAQLEGCQAFELIPVQTGCNCLPELAETNTPRVLLLDLAVTTPDSAVALLRAHPDLMLIGVDPSSEELLVLTCQSTTASSVADLVGVIKHWADTWHHRGG